MNISILTLGSELTNGQILDTNTQWIAQQVQQMGFSIKLHLTVADNIPEITSALQYCQANSNIILMTGGLGATDDDKTLQALCSWSQDTLIVDEALQTHISNYYSRSNRPIPSYITQLSSVPQKAKILYNQLGLAPGLLLHHQDCFCIAMPGVPFEMKHVFTEQVQPWLQAQYPNLQAPKSLHYQCGLIAEKQIELSIQNILDNYQLQAAYLPNFGQVSVEVKSEHQLSHEQWQAIDQEISTVLQLHIFSKEKDESIAQALVKLLQEKNLSISTAESCTGGLITHLLSNVVGASNVLKGGMNTYSTSSKIQTLGVPASIVDAHTVYSKEVAESMAINTRLQFDATIGISTTGMLDQTPEGVQAYAYVSISNGNLTISEFISLPYSRTANKELLAQKLLFHTCNFIDKNY